MATITLSLRFFLSLWILILVAPRHGTSQFSRGDACAALCGSGLLRSGRGGSLTGRAAWPWAWPWPNFSPEPFPSPSGSDFPDVTSVYIGGRLTTVEERVPGHVVHPRPSSAGRG